MGCATIFGILFLIGIGCLLLCTPLGPILLIFIGGWVIAKLLIFFFGDMK